MDMRIGGGNSSAWAAQGVAGGNRQPLRAALDTVRQDLKSGDLAGAKQAFDSLNIDTSKLNADSPLGKLASALKSNDLPGAQAAAQSFGHHRHHHAHGTQSAQLPAAPAITPVSLTPGSVQLFA